MNRVSQSESLKVESQKSQIENEKLNKLIKELETVKKTYHKNMDGYKFGQVLGDLHAFTWHRFADIYIEELKEELKAGNGTVQKELEKAFLDCIIMLHPFIPFETEALWQVFKGENESVLTQKV